MIFFGHVMTKLRLPIVIMSSFGHHQAFPVITSFFKKFLVIIIAI